MGTTKFTGFNTQSSAVNAFLGGITFTALVMVSQSHDTFKMADVLIPLTAFTSLLFIIVTLSSMKHDGVHPYFFKFNVLLMTIGFSILTVVIIPMIVSTFNYVASLVLTFSAMILIAITSIFTVMNKNYKNNS